MFQSPSNIFIKIFTLLLVGHSALFVFSASGELYEHFAIQHAKYDDYHDHCQFNAIFMSLLMAWYFIIIILIASTRYLTIIEFG